MGMKEARKIELLTAALLLGGVAAKYLLPEENVNFAEKNIRVQKTPNQKLMDAAIDGDVDAAHKALAEGADINYRDPTTGQTVLMVSMEMNSSILHQGKAFAIVNDLLDNENLNITLKDAQNKSLEDYVNEYITNADNMAHNFVSPNTYSVGTAAHKVKKVWKSVLGKIKTKQKNQKLQKTASEKICFHAFSRRNLRS